MRLCNTAEVRHIQGMEPATPLKLSEYASFWTSINPNAITASVLDVRFGLRIQPINATHWLNRER